MGGVRDKKKDNEGNFKNNNENHNLTMETNF